MFEGDRIKYLQNAIETIAYNIGVVAEAYEFDPAIKPAIMLTMLKVEQQNLTDAVSGTFPRKMKPQNNIDVYNRNFMTERDEHIGMITVLAPIFELGKFVVTDGALETFLVTINDKRRFNEELRPYIERYMGGDWNVQDKGDRRMNTLAMRDTSDRVFDAFTHNGVRYNIVTYPGAETCLLLASEY